MTPLQYYLLRNMERIYCLIGLMMIAGAFTPFLYGFRVPGATRDLANEVDQGTIAFQAMSLTIYSIGLAYILAERARLPKLLLANWALLAVTGFALFSAFWSYYPDAAFRRGFALVLSTTFAFYLVLRFTPRELLELVGWALLLGAAISLVVTALFPGSTIHGGPLAGSWMGSFGHKNRLGRMMALGVVLFALLIPGKDKDGGRRLFLWGGLGMCGLLLAM